MLLAFFWDLSSTCRKLTVSLYTVDLGLRTSGLVEQKDLSHNGSKKLMTYIERKGKDKQLKEKSKGMCVL